METRLGIPQRTNSGKRCTPSVGRITTWPGRKGEPPYGLPFLCFLVATVGAVPTCHVLCHDRLSPLKPRILKLSVPGKGGAWCACPLQLHYPTLQEAYHPDHLHDRLPPTPTPALSCLWSQYQQLSDIMYLLVFCFCLSGNVVLQTHLTCLPMSIPRPGKSRRLKVPAQ